MKAEILVKKEVEVKTLVVKAHVQYWEDAKVSDMPDMSGKLIPCKEGELWCPIIDVDLGRVTNWSAGVTADIHYKVCDEGSYYLKDEEGNILFSIEQGYVPAMLCPEENGYGDYIIMKIDRYGDIHNWNPNLEGFVND